MGFGLGENYYRLAALPPPYDRGYLKVCVAFGPADALGREAIGVVVTAYPARSPKHGDARKWS